MAILFEQKNNKEMMVLNDTFNHLDFIDIYRTLYPKQTDYSTFLSAHETFSKTDHTLGTKEVSTNSRVKKLYQAFFLTTVV